jgi:chitodextrinase
VLDYLDRKQMHVDIEKRLGTLHSDKQETKMLFGARLFFTVFIAALSLPGCGGGSSSGGQPARTSSPSIPANLSATAVSSSAVNLTWAASTDNGGVIKYQVFRNSGAAAIAQPTGTSMTDTSVVANTNYSYQVRAVDASNNASALSNVARVTTPSLPGTSLPAAPSGLVVAAGNAQVTLNWNAVGGVTGYKVYRNGNLVGSPTTASFTDAGLANGTSYSYQVSGVNSAGEGAKSAAVTATPVSTANAGFPGPHNTGYRNAPGYPGQLTTYSATPIANQECSGPIQSNQTYHFCRFEQAPPIGAVNAPVNNTTFFGCDFLSNALDNADVTFANGNNVTFSYDTFEPSAVTAPPVAYGKGYQYGINQVQDDRSSNYLHGDSFSVDHSDFWGFGNGIQIGLSTQTLPVTITDSWFHDASAPGSSNGAPIYHVDAILDSDGGSDESYIVIKHNTIVSVGNTNGVALQYSTQGYNNITVTDNYVSGFGYTLNIGGNGNLTNSVVTGNVFGTDIQPVFGPLYGWNSSGVGNVWRNNTWLVVPGTTWSAASNNGLYWWPDGTLSATDYSGH